VRAGLRQQYQNWPRALNDSNSWRSLADTPKPARAIRDATEWLDLRQAVEHALLCLQVKAVVIDEAQHLMQGKARHRPVDQLDWLKSMTSRTNAFHVLVGTHDECDFRNLNGQARRRGRDLHFPRYHVETVAGRTEFVGALRHLLEHVPLRCDMGDLLALVCGIQRRVCGHRQNALQPAQQARLECEQAAVIRLPLAISHRLRQ
jgi:hypothetical protein